MLWIKDMQARTLGKRHQMIEFQGATFAANRNIAIFHIERLVTLEKLRFKKVRYKWISFDNRPHTIKLKSPDDKAIIRESLAN